jgi:hypothetical protein
VEVEQSESYKKLEEALKEAEELGKEIAELTTKNYNFVAVCE